MTDRHENHHRLIGERVAAWRALPKRSGMDKIRRREAYKRAAHTVQGHLRSEHGTQRVGGRPIGMVDLETNLAEHDRLHREETT